MIKVKVLLLPHNELVEFFFCRSASNKQETNDQLTQIQYRLHNSNNSNESKSKFIVLVTGW